MRFFIARLSSLGDVVCSLPVAVALKRSFPGCETVWAVDRRFRGVVDACKAVDRVIEAKPRWRPATWRVGEGEFDAALDLQGLFKSAILVATCKARQKVGYHWQREGAWLFSERVIPDPSSFHIVDQYVDVARYLGANADRAEFEMTPSDAATNSVRAKLGAMGVGESFVAINAGAGWATKRWPAQHYARLTCLLSDLGVQAVFLGGAAITDREAFEEVCMHLPAGAERPKELLGQTTVSELVALLQLAQAHVGGDTGSTHIAAGLGVPAIGLYSITRPQRSCPYGQIERCLYDPDGLHRISPEAVLQKVSEVNSCR